MLTHNCNQAGGALPGCQLPAAVCSVSEATSDHAQTLNSTLRRMWSHSCLSHLLDV